VPFRIKVAETSSDANTGPGGSWWSGTDSLGEEPDGAPRGRFGPQDTSRQRRMVERTEEVLRLGTSLSIKTAALEAHEGAEKARSRCNNIRGVESGDMKLQDQARASCLPDAV